MDLWTAGEIGPWLGNHKLYSHLWQPNAQSWCYFLLHSQHHSFHGWRFYPNRYLFHAGNCSILIRGHRKSLVQYKKNASHSDPSKSDSENLKLWGNLIQVYTFLFKYTQAHTLVLRLSVCFLWVTLSNKETQVDQDPFAKQDTSYIPQMYNRIFPEELHCLVDSR